MNTTTKSYSIGVMGVVKRESGETAWVHLPQISEYLTAFQILPTIGDLVSTHKNDWPLLGLDAEKVDYRSVLIVKQRIFSYGLVDVAVVCQFQEEDESTGALSQWQKIPLN